MVVFGVGAVYLSDVALVGIAVGAASATAFTWVSLGKRAVYAGVVSGLVGAVVAWGAMRSMMRWVAVTSGRLPVLTLEGTSAILLTSIAMSVLPAMGYVHLRRRLGPPFSRGLVYGALLSVVGGVPMILLLSSEINAIARVPLIPVAFLLGVPVAYALALEATHRAFEGRWLYR